MSTQIASIARLLRSILGRGISAPARRQTYRNLLYLLLMFPLGLVYVNLVVVGLITGFGLAIIGIGIPLVVLVLAVATGLAALERTLVRTLLGVEIPPPSTESGGGLRSERCDW